MVCADFPNTFSHRFQRVAERPYFFQGLEFLTALHDFQRFSTLSKA